ncbi:hypothetical protein DB30_07317 [Enhygromyxa salina]|uniref:Uncharacterized protein n=1 Tax=Enhygromyxa salina TaxID=215803 RepID=A0A0C2CWP9_9BACT|nr:hypothetical protein DB30_07317 [Enhygromyxa salina]
MPSASSLRWRRLARVQCGLGHEREARLRAAALSWRASF